MTFDVPVAVIRPFNTYGPRQSARAVIPTIVTQALASDTMKMGSLDLTRDLTYVSDTVEGFTKVAESDKVIGQEVNLGAGKETSIAELVNVIASLLGKQIKVQQDAGRIRPERSEVKRLVSNNSKAKDLVGWLPRVSLDDGLKMTIQWIRNNIESYKSGIYNI